MIEEEKNDRKGEERIGTPVSEPATEKLEESEISSEAKQRAAQIIFETMEISPDTSLDKFQEKLTEAIKSLPRYRELEEKMKKISRENFVYELFKIIRRESDGTSSAEQAKDLENKKLADDGGLIKSIRKGELHCAGRVMIASTFLAEHGVRPVVASGLKGDGGHSIFLAELDNETMAYCDPESNLYFTFPKDALDGYQGSGAASKCQIRDYTPRDKDTSDGMATIMREFLVMPAQEGIARQYLENVAAALAGNKEFAKSDIPINKETEGAVHKIIEEQFGKNAEIDAFYEGENYGRMKEVSRKQDEIERGEILDIFRMHPSKEDFVNFFSKAISGNPGQRLPYIKNAPEEVRRSYAEKVWVFLIREKDKANK